MYANNVTLNDNLYPLKHLFHPLRVIGPNFAA